MNFKQGANALVWRCSCKFDCARVLIGQVIKLDTPVVAVIPGKRDALGWPTFDVIPAWTYQGEQWPCPHGGHLVRLVLERDMQLLPPPDEVAQHDAIEEAKAQADADEKGYQGPHAIYEVSYGVDMGAPGGDRNGWVLWLGKTMIAWGVDE